MPPARYVNAPIIQISTAYHHIGGRAEFTKLDRKIFNSTFRIQYWQNLIHNRPRIFGFDTLIQNLPTKKTICDRWFRRDFRTLFHPQSNPMTPEETEIDKTEELESAESLRIQILCLLALPAL